MTVQRGEPAPVTSHETSSPALLGQIDRQARPAVLDLGHSGRVASTNRTDLIISVLEDAFAPLMKADPVAFRGKFRKMASDPHSFYRGSACLFYADVTPADDPFVN